MHLGGLVHVVPVLDRDAMKPTQVAFISLFWTQSKISEVWRRFGGQPVAEIYRLQLPEVDVEQILEDQGGLAVKIFHGDMMKPTQIVIIAVV